MTEQMRNGLTNAGLLLLLVLVLAAFGMVCMQVSGPAMEDEQSIH
jgi:hypothetical protein